MLEKVDTDHAYCDSLTDCSVPEVIESVLVWYVPVGHTISCSLLSVTL
jgi:hypothetical protein